MRYLSWERKYWDTTGPRDQNSLFRSILCTVPTHQLGMIYAGRLLTGLGVGGLAAASPIYTSEIAPPAIRGRLTGLYVNHSPCPASILLMFL